MDREHAYEISICNQMLRNENLQQAVSEHWKHGITDS